MSTFTFINTAYKNHSSSHGCFWFFFSPIAINTVKGAGDAVQMLEGLPSIRGALDSTLSTTQNQT